MPATLPRSIRKRRDQLIQQVQCAGDVLDVFATASAQLAGLVSFDGAAWLSTDPATGLPTAPTRIENLGRTDPDQCTALWRREFLLDDVNLYRGIARAGLPAAAMQVSGRDLRGSLRYRDFVRPLGFSDELRAVLRVGRGGSIWGLLALFRRRDHPPFTDHDVRTVASLSAPLAEALRMRARPPATVDGHAHDVPGLLVFDATSTLASINEPARMWLAELPPDDCVPSALGVPVPMWIVGTASRAGAAANLGGGTARARVRTRRGTWIVCHASCLRNADGGVETVAVVLEPAGANQVAPIVAQAYGLSEREQQITALIARGAATGEIARALFLSTHTVRDHVKAIFAKVGVSTRGELVATLYADHYEPGHLNGPVVMVR